MDIITIYNEDNIPLKMEVVLIYQMNNSNFNYLIYRNIEQTEYFIAKYIGHAIVNLDTELTSKELKYANSILNEVVKNEIKT